MKTPKEVFNSDNPGSNQKKALEMIRAFVKVNGSKFNSHIQCLSGTRIGINNDTAGFANPEFTKGFFLFLYFADQMKTCFTRISFSENQIYIDLRSPKNWGKFIEEFKELD